MPLPRWLLVARPKPRRLLRPRPPRLLLRPRLPRRPLPPPPTPPLAPPLLALAAGDDGNDILRRILRDAKAHLSPGGVLLVDMGHNRDLVEAAFPRLPFLWLATEASDAGVFLLRAGDLP